MTQKDLRDIAAYWGAKCHTHVKLLVQVDHMLMRFLETYAEIGSGGFIKLHLRPISSLTDDECKTAFSLALPGRTAEEVFRNGNDIFVWYKEKDDDERDIVLRLDGALGFYSLYRETGVPGEAIDSVAGAVIAYLQSIHVYVPGTIDEQFVELR